MEASGPIKERPEVAVGSVGEGSGQAKEIDEVVEPSVRKRRRLEKAGQAVSMQGGTVV